jgi:hypothetical protein
MCKAIEALFFFKQDIRSRLDAALPVNQFTKRLSANIG